LNSRAATLATSASAAARKFGRPSRIVTCEPRRFQTLPSSRPITPAPMTPRRLGTLSKSSAPMLSTMCSPNFANGSSIESEPAARTTLLPLSSTVLPSCCFTVTTLPGCSWPKPWYAATLLALNSAAMPPVNCFTILSLRPIMVPTSIFASLVLIPCSPKMWPRFQNWREESSSALEGMQPTRRQVPPSAGLPSLPSAASTQATFMPSCAARIAAW